MTKNKVPTGSSVDEVEAMAASAAVLYHVKSGSAIASDNGWACAALFEAAGAPKYLCAAELGRENATLLWKSTLKPLLVAFSLLMAATCSSDIPAQAGLLSFLHHRKKHQTEPTVEQTDFTQNGQSSLSPSLPPQPTQSPTFSRQSYYKPAPTNPSNRFGQGSSASTMPISNASVRPVKREVFPAQPTNRACLGNQSHIIRIAVALNAASFELVTLDGAQIFDATSGEMVATLSPQSRWSGVSASQALLLRRKLQNQVASARWSKEYTALTASKITPVAYYPPSAPNIDYDRSRPLSLPFISNSSRAGFFVKPVSSGNQEGVIGLNGRFFRGALCLQPANSSATAFNAINYLPVEDYLLSVVPSEMPSAWPLEALKAQSIAARSYAYANMNKHGSEGYDLKDNTEDQAYSGIKAEYNSTNNAVASTKNLVLKYDGKPICAYFHSTSGGSTEFSENVWSKSLPYLKAVADYDDQSPHFSWNRKFAIGEIEGKLGPGLGPILNLFVVSRSNSQRVSNLLVTGKSDARLLSGESVRRQLKLPSTNFNVFSSPGSYTFCGRGFGHGLGLSQWGSKALAEQGYNAAQILTYYYKDIVVEPVADGSGS